MTLREKINIDMKDAMRAKKELELSVLRMLLSAMHNREIEKKAKGGDGALTDEEVLAAIRSEVKKRRDAVEGFEKGGRRDLADKEFAESKILEIYLPQELPDADIEKIADEAIRSVDGATMKEFGKVMGAAMKMAGGRASGDRVGAVIRKKLGA